MRASAAPRTLIVGGDGMIGKALARRLSADGLEVTCTSRRRRGGDLRLDLASIGDAARVTDGFDCVILAAAVTGRAACHLDPEGSSAVNVTAPVALAEPVLARGGQVVFLSTHAVLGGEKSFLKADAPYDPPDLYAEQKAEAEQRLQDLNGPTGLTIVRPTKVLARDGGLIRNWISTIERRIAIDVYTDLVMAPISVGHVVEQIAAIITRRHLGIVHLSGAIELSYADFASELAQRMAWPGELVRMMKGRPVNPIAALTPWHASLSAKEPQELEDVIVELMDGTP